MHTSSSPGETADRLFDILSSPRFLNMEGLANEVPLFIQTYETNEEDRMAAAIHSLVTRLRNGGVEVAEVDLFQLMIDELRDEGLLDDIVADEKDFDREDLFSTLKNYSDPETRIVPRLVSIVNESNARLTIVSGAGHVFPFLRTHTLLDSIQPAMMHHPIVLFFPGEYNQVTGFGSQLRLFGSLPAKGYYRAFNLDQYRLPNS